jgi:hypothetical protein
VDGPVTARHGVLRGGVAVAILVANTMIAGGGDGASAALRTRPEARTIRWDGFTWAVRKGFGGPGPNHWVRSNVRVDGDGYLHLRIAFDGLRWTCAELEMTDRLGFGTYSWVVDGPIDSLDPNVVLGLFDYPTTDVGQDGTNEIDVEYARWGNASYPPGNFTVWPAKEGLRQKGRAFDFALNGGVSVSTFTRASTSVAFQATDLDGTPLGSWTFAPNDPKRHISQAPMPVHINLWLFGGDPPTDGRSVELVIRSFSFTPAGP